VTWEDRKLLTELAWVSKEAVPLAMKIIDGDATADEQHKFAERLFTLAERLHGREGVSDLPTSHT